MDKHSFVLSLENKNLFWSYTKGNIAELPDEVIIETVLVYGSTEDVIQLFKFYDSNNIRKVWQTNIISDNRQYRLNVYLAKVFFNITNTEKYFKKYSKNSRYERIKKLASTHRISID